MDAEFMSELLQQLYPIQYWKTQILTIYNMPKQSQDGARTFKLFAATAAAVPAFSGEGDERTLPPMACMPAVA